ncbi:MAG: site-2 protease family protein [Acidobacteriaceae bacterium]
MRGWSFAAGRWFGVELRVHAFVLVLLGLTVGSSTYAGVSAGRGILLWLLILAAVAMREVARAMVAAWEGLELQSILLLPTGGLLSYGNSESNEAASSDRTQWRMSLAGPITNAGFGLVITGLMLSLTPGLSLWEHPWITPTRLLRSAVWVNLLLGFVHLLPAAPLDGGRLLRGRLVRAKGVMPGARTASSVAQSVAFALVLGGASLANLWLVALGVLVMFGPQLESDSLLLDSDVDAITMRDVMLRNFNTISASETLEGALESAVHSLQDVFPVVRGGNVVGAVSRQGIVEALRADGNGYVQGVMTRTLATARPEDSLVKTLRRMMGARGVQMVPVVEGERVVGIITPQNLAHSMRMLNQRRRLRRSSDGRG